MSLHIHYATVEMSDGTVFDSERITLQDRLRLERSARANGWSISDPNYLPTTNAFLAWAALERTGQIQLTFEDFTAGGAVDLNLTMGTAELVDPTQPTPGTA